MSMTRTRYAGAIAPAQRPIEDTAERGPGGDGHGLVGETCFHVDYPDFRCKVLRVDDGRAHVRVLGGWRGPRLPKESMPVPTAKLEVLS